MLMLSMLMMCATPPAPRSTDRQASSHAANVLVAVRDPRNRNEVVELKGLDICQVCVLGCAQARTVTCMRGHAHAQARHGLARVRVHAPPR